jgi:hypothetical protein
MRDKQAAGSRQQKTQLDASAPTEDCLLHAAYCPLLTQIWSCSDILAYCFGCGYGAPGSFTATWFGPRVGELQERWCKEIRFEAIFVPIQEEMR